MNEENIYDEFLESKDKNPVFPPDLIIEEGEGYFHAKMSTSRLHTNTGRGGLGLIASTMGTFDTLKILYNEKILNLQERRELFNRIKK